MMIVISALLLMWMGFVALATTMAKHQDALGSKLFTTRQQYAWQAAGWILLALSLGPCLLRWNPSIALAAWCGLLTIATMALGLMFTYTPRLIGMVKMVIGVVNTFTHRPAAQVSG